MNSVEGIIYPPLPINTANKFRVFIRNIELFKSATINVVLYNDNDNKTILNSLIFKLEGDEYLNWADDKYIMDYVKNKLQNK